jgi:predicted nuclease with TOPRIM domain
MFKYITMQYIDKFSKYALAVAILIIIYLIVTRPKAPIASDEYKERAAQLQKEKEQLLMKRDSIMASLDASKAEINDLKQKDSALVREYIRNKQLLTAIKNQHEKNLAAIDNTSSDDLKRLFAELQER